MTDNNAKLRFPLWRFLNQPLFNAQCPLVLNPQLFWQRYQIDYLERCWIRTFRPEENFRNRSD